MSFIVDFLQSNWMTKATKCAYNLRRLKVLVFQLGLFLSRKGLVHLREQLNLMYCYLRDIATGKYKDYDICSLIYIIAATLYLLSPVDMIPDFLPMIRQLSYGHWMSHLRNWSDIKSKPPIVEKAIETLKRLGRWEMALFPSTGESILFKMILLDYVKFHSGDSINNDDCKLETSDKI